MPELPEVESIKRQLKPDLLGKIISGIKVLSAKNFVGDKEKIIGQKIISVERYGKVLVFKLVNTLIRQQGNKFLNIHFKLSGQMLYAEKVNKSVFKNIIPFTGGKIMPANTTRVIFEFNDGSGLFFNDLRKFGWIKISQQPLAPKGIDVLSKHFTVKYLTVIFKSTSRSIKMVLMDQDKITGIGNIYANDSLFVAKINPLRKANSLTEKEIKKLHEAIVEEINKGIIDQGSSGSDEAFILPDGSRGNHQRHFLVYDQEKKPCKNCKTLIKRIKHNGRSSYFCPTCQK